MSGRSKLMTWSTSGTSMPRASTSVATRMDVLPRRKFSSARRRWPCDLSEWMDSARYPARRSSSAHSSVRNFVRANTMTRSDPFSSSTARKSSGLSKFLMGIMNCSTVLAVSPLRAISTMAGSFRSEPRFFSMERSMVAENRSVWRSAGVASTMVVTAGKKPMSSMRSASSSTSTSMRPRSTTSRSMRSFRRPGVAMSTSVPRRISLICGP